MRRLLSRRKSRGERLMIIPVGEKKMQFPLGMSGHPALQALWVVQAHHAPTASIQLVGLHAPDGRQFACPGVKKRITNQIALEESKTRSESQTSCGV